ncbi:hypothetical protein ONR07_24440, partial [Salmonella enterica subsp. enterica serovar Anatum]|nr:hypothetical protein [Salmonella enterica subsp. enterica serovar Anatum]
LSIHPRHQLFKTLLHGVFPWTDHVETGYLAFLFLPDFVIHAAKAFEIAARHPAEPDKEVRLACRDIFRSSKLTGKLIPLIEEVL